MLAPILMGLAAGQRAFTPLATMAVAAATRQLPPGSGAPRIIAHPLIATATVILAVAELAGDKMKSAPDRTVPIGLATRLVTSAIAGAALVPRHQRWIGAALGGLTAVAASYPGWRARTAAMPRFGQTPTGLAEDALVITAAIAIQRLLARRRPA